MQHNEPVRIRNTSSTRTWSDGYDNITYSIPPGGETIAPFIAACIWFGHPEAVDTDADHRYRTDEFKRLRVRYGVLDVITEHPDSGHHIGPADTICCPISQEEQWQRNKPPVEVFSLDGSRIITVTDDPDGSEITPTVTTMAEADNLRTQLEAMQKQMAQLQTQLDRQVRGDAAEANSGPIASDTPGSITVPMPDLSGIEPMTPDKVDPDAEVTEDTPTRVRVGSPR